MRLLTLRLIEYLSPGLGRQRIEYRGSHMVHAPLLRAAFEHQRTQFLPDLTVLRRGPPGRWKTCVQTLAGRYGRHHDGPAAQMIVPSDFPIRRIRRCAGGL
jgi:hypothetical protein